MGNRLDSVDYLLEASMEADFDGARRMTVEEVVAETGRPEQLVRRLLGANVLPSEDGRYTVFPSDIQRWRLHDGE